MKKQNNNSVSRRGFVAGTTALAGSLGFPAILGAQPAAVKVGLIHPVTGFVAYNGQQGRLGGTMAIEDINKAGGIKSMGGAKLEALLGDSQSKVEVGVAEVEKMNEQGVAAYIGCFQSPVTIAATQAAAKYNTPFLIDVARLGPDRQSRAQEHLPPDAGLRRLRRRRHHLAGRAQQGRQQRRQDRRDRPRVRASSAPARPSCSRASCRRSASRPRK